MRENIIFNKKNGFGLVELIVIIAIIGIDLTYVLGASAYFIKVSGGIDLARQANLINESNIENLRALRDSSWTNSIAPLTNGGTYYTVVNNGIISTTTINPGVLYQNFNTSIQIDAVYRDANSNIAISGTLDPDIKKITSTTTWTYRGQNKSAQLITYLANLNGN